MEQVNVFAVSQSERLVTLRERMLLHVPLGTNFKEGLARCKQARNLKPRAVA